MAADSEVFSSLQSLHLLKAQPIFDNFEKKLKAGNIELSLASVKNTWWQIVVFS